MQSPEKHIIISGGGTGGHIFPAIAIANSLKEKLPSARILFIGAKGKMEMEKVPAAGYPIEGLWISGFRRNLSLDNLMFPVKVISSLLKSRQIIRRFRPDIVVGVGGFASGPTLRMACRMGVPTLILEQNFFPGITNRLLAKNVDRICVAFEGMDKYFPSSKIIITGNPVRKEVIRTEGKRQEASDYFGLEPDKLVVLVIGGSQGALSVNKVILSNLSLLKSRAVQILWQTGRGYFEQANDAIRELKYGGVKVIDFIHRMDLAYSLADIVISRAGAIAIAELAIVQKPVIFIPFPGAAEDHQMKNAMRLADKKAAIVIADHEAGEKLPGILGDLLDNKEKCEELRNNIKAFAVYNAAEKIVNEIISLMK